MATKKKVAPAPMVEAPATPEVRRPEVIQAEFENTLKFLGKVEFDIQALTFQKQQLVQTVSNLGAEARLAEATHAAKPLSKSEQRRLAVQKGGKA
jgi:hypothetical protein